MFTYCLLRKYKTSLRIIMTSNGSVCRLKSQFSQRKPELRCTPLSSLIDQKNKVIIESLEPGENVTLRANLVGDSQDKYHSFAHFVADCEGRVCVGSQASVGGFYEGVDPMGMIWSMRQGPGQRKGLRLSKKDVTKPYEVSLAVFRGHVVDDNSCDEALCCLTFKKWYMGEGVRRIPIQEGNIRATLFLPPGDGKFPGVLDMFGSAGGLTEYKASLLASHGFAALALAYFRFDDLPDKLEDLTLEYFIEAKEWLHNHPQVLPGGIGVMGISKGSDFGMFLAANSTDIRALVSVSPFHGFLYSPLRYKGQQTRYVPVEASGVVIEADGSLDTRNAYLEGWTGDIRDNPFMIPVENIQCPTLLVYGRDDKSTNAELSVQKIMQRLKSFGKGKEFTVLGYDGAGHLIEPPYTPHCYMAYHVMSRVNLSWGGQPQAHSFAQEDSWRKILNFFSKNLPRETKSQL